MEQNEYFSQKIQAYLDGSLKDSEVAEFEAYASTHSDFLDKLEKRKNLDDLLASTIPEIILDKEAQQSLELEIKEVIKNLYRPSSDKISEKVGFWWREVF